MSTVENVSEAVCYDDTWILTYDYSSEAEQALSTLNEQPYVDYAERDSLVEIKGDVNGSTMVDDCDNGDVIEEEREVSEGDFEILKAITEDDIGKEVVLSNITLTVKEIQEGGSVILSSDFGDFCYLNDLLFSIGQFTASGTLMYSWSRQYTNYDSKK